MKINKDQLQEALTIVQPGLASKDIIEQANSFAFLDDKVVTYNDRISLSHPIEGLDIKGAIYAEELYKLLQKIKEGEINISIDKNEVNLKFGKGSARLTLQEEIKIPLIPIKGEWEKLPDNFNRFLKFAMSACSKDMSQPELTCVNVKTNGIIQATDSYKISHCDLKKPMPVEDFLLPASMTKDVIKINPTHVNKKGDDKWIHFKNEKGTVISCRLMESEKDYPTLQKHLNIEGEQIQLPKTTAEILGKAWVFAKRDNLLEETIRISIESKRMVVFSQSETGSFSEKTLIHYEGNPVEFLIAPHLLIDILKETNQCILNENFIKFEGEGWQYASALQSEE